MANPEWDNYRPFQRLKKEDFDMAHPRSVDTLLDGPTPDPWAHRSTQMRCSTCMWFLRKETTEGNPSTLGRCRRHAPTMNGFPVVFLNDWCGDHKLDERKV